MAEHRYTLHSRPVSTKNSRVLGGGRSFMSRAAKERMAELKTQLQAQHRHAPPLSGQFALEAVVTYGNRAGWLDGDNSLSCILDSVKGILVPDDSPLYLPRMSIESRLGAADQIDIVLRELTL